MNIKKYIRHGEGAADITPLLADKDAFKFLIDSLANLGATVHPSKIVSVEGRGFVLGSALSYKLNAGFVPVRIKGKLKNLTYEYSYLDYSSQTKTLEILQDAIEPGEPVIIVDDWVQTGGTIKAAISLVEKCGGVVKEVVVMMDDSSPSFKVDMAKYNYHFLERTSFDDKF